MKEKMELGYQKQPDQIKELYSVEDFSMWESGANRYKNFIKDVKELDKYSESRINEIQAMFLGEKPAVLNNNFADDYKENLEKLGFKFVGKYCYSPILVQAIIEKYKDDVPFQIENPESLMEELSKSDLKEQNIIRGLILGFPLTAVLGYEDIVNSGIDEQVWSLFEILPPPGKDFLMETYYDKREGNQEMLTWIISKFVEYQNELKINEEELAKAVDALRTITNAKIIRIRGVNWVDYNSSPESILKQERLINAFEKSGILLG